VRLAMWDVLRWCGRTGARDRNLAGGACVDPRRL